MIHDEASYCGPVRPVWTVRCFYASLMGPQYEQCPGPGLWGTSPFLQLARPLFRVRVRVLWLELRHSRVLARCENGLDPVYG